MKFEIVVIKPGELFLKSPGVRERLLKLLSSNIRACLIANKVAFSKIQIYRNIILINSKETSKVIEFSKNIFGISLLAEGIEIETNLDAMRQKVFDLFAGLDSTQSFAVRAKRSDKSFELNSKELEMQIGGFVQEKTNAKVDLTNPDRLVNVYIVGGRTIVFGNEIKGLHGLPVGTSGKACVLVESEKDFAAAWLTMSRGVVIFPVHIGDLESWYEEGIKDLQKFAFSSVLKPNIVANIADTEGFCDKYGLDSIVLGKTKLDLDIISKFDKKRLVLTPLIGLKDSEINNIIKQIKL